MGRKKPSTSRKQSVDDGDTVEVKRESSVDANLAQEMDSRFTKLKRDDSSSNSRSPSVQSNRFKSSRSPSVSSLSHSKPTLDEMEAKPKSEQLNGHVSPTKPEATKTKPGRSVTSRGPPPRIAPLFDDFPDVTTEATSQFQVIETSTYQNKYLGLTESALECDCSEEWDASTRQNHACGDSSDCINRATKMECQDDCTCGSKCQNQRFTRRLYADVSVIQTEKKGYGLRANQALKPGDFIFEYIGEVIAEAAFRRRMIAYDQENIKHFYFMSLSKGEFVDATKRGNLGRFCNHSCNPNCYVDKWVVGEKLRMGIFAERNVKAGEELVFNYNVDRYGANPQPCYCGESNCTGFIGGKTQTEAGTKLSAATIEALGIEDDVDDWDTLVAKKPKKKKTAEDDEDYVDSVQVKALDPNGVTKVMAALMQCKEKWIAVKLLQRIQTTEDEMVRHRIVRLHGYRILNSQLAAWKEDENIVLQILDILDSLPRLTRNKIVDARLDQTLQNLESHQDGRVASRASALSEAYSQLELAYRIPRKKRDETGTPTKAEPNLFERREAVQQRKRSRSRSKSPPKGPSNIPSGPRAQRLGGPPPRPPPFARGPPALPRGWFSAQDKGRTYYYSASGQTTWARPTQPADQPPPPPKQPSEQDVLKSIIEGIVTQKDKDPKPATVEEPEPTKKDKKEEKWKSLSEEKQQKLYENTLYPHISHVMSKYKHKIPKEDLKRFGKEISKKLVSSDYKAGRVKDPTKIDDKQERKVKDFCKQFFDRAAHKHKKSEEERERANRKSKDVGAASVGTPGVMSPATDLEVSPMLKKEESEDEDADVKMEEMGDKPTPDTPSERSHLKRKRGTSSPVIKQEGLGLEDTADKSPHKKPTPNVDTPPPPPPPPAPIETPPADTPEDGDDGMEVEADLHDEGDTMFRDKSMADVRALAQMEGVDEDMGDQLDRAEEG